MLKSRGFNLSLPYISQLFKLLSPFFIGQFAWVYMQIVFEHSVDIAQNCLRQAQAPVQRPIANSLSIFLFSELNFIKSEHKNSFLILNSFFCSKILKTVKNERKNRKES